MVTAIDGKSSHESGRSGDKSLDPRSIRDWIFDLDNTVYPTACDLFAQIDARINSFIQDYLALGPVEARTLQSRYFRDHGSSLAGLMLHHDLAPSTFLDFVHEIDLTVLDPAPELGETLAALPGRKLIYTNGSTRHAERVLERLGIIDHFSEIFDIAAADFRPKPRPEPLDELLARHGIEPSTTVFVEDLARNLEPAAAVGITTVWVAPEPNAAHPGPHVHHVTHDLAGWLAEIAAT